jgi:hypothetical protein
MYNHDQWPTVIVLQVEKPRKFTTPEQLVPPTEQQVQVALSYSMCDLVVMEQLQGS